MRKVLRHNGAYLAERSVPDRLGSLGVSLLVLFGAADPRWDPASAHEYDVVPGAQVELLPGVGHVPMLEAPDATSTLLLAFTTDERRAGKGATTGYPSRPESANDPCRQPNMQ